MSSSPIPMPISPPIYTYLPLSSDTDSYIPTKPISEYMKIAEFNSLKYENDKLKDENEALKSENEALRKMLCKQHKITIK